MPEKPSKNNLSPKATIVLAMHGTPPKDFPPKERQHLFELRARLRESKKPSPALVATRDALYKKMCTWPRSEKNDPFYIGSQALGKQLSLQTGLGVIVGFNEFCDPDLDTAIDMAAKVAAQTGSEHIIVTTPMATRGGGHSKGDIPAAIERGKVRHPNTEITYAWPFPVSDVAAFLARQIAVFLDPPR